MLSPEQVGGWYTRCAQRGYVRTQGKAGQGKASQAKPRQGKPRQAKASQGKASFVLKNVRAVQQEVAKSASTTSYLYVYLYYTLDRCRRQVFVPTITQQY